MNIRTDYWQKPIPTNRFDWSAVDEDRYDGAPDGGADGRRIGHGATEREAIVDLLETIRDLSDDKAYSALAESELAKL